MRTTDLSPAMPETGEPTSSTPPRRPLRRRLSAGHTLMIVAALLAGLANYSLLTADDARTPIVVADRDLSSGQQVEPASFRSVDATAGLLTDRLLGPNDLASGGAYAGWILATDLPEGAPLRPSDLRAPSSVTNGLRRMSLPVASENAVGGAIQPGDTIDVVHVLDGDSAFLVSGAEVLAVSSPGSSSLQAVRRFQVTIAVDPDTALCLASALDDGELHLLLSTGQQAVPARGCVEWGR